MISLAEVAPVAPAAGPALIALGACITFIVMWGVDKFWRATLGPIFVHMGNIGFGGIHGRLSAHPLHFLVSANDAVENWIKQAMGASERAIVWGFGTLLWFFYDLSFTIVKAVYDLNTAIDNVWHNVATTDATPVNARVKARLDKLAAREAALEHRLGRLEHAKRAGGAAAGAQDFERLNRGIDRLGKEIDQVRRREATLEKTAGRTHAHAETGITGVPHWVARRLGRVEKATVGFGAVALVAAALGRMRLGWLRCPALLRLGNRFGCGGFSFLEALLAVTFEAIVITDLCLVVNAMTKAARLFAKELEYLSTQISGLIECQDASRPDALSVAWFEPPPLSPYVET